MSFACTVEVRGATVGMAIRTDDGYEFKTNERMLYPLDAKIFGSLPEIERNVRKILDNTDRSGRIINVLPK